jgi:peroxiredoxin
MPHTQEIAAKYKDQGVVVVASGTSDNIAKFKEWIPKNQPKYPDMQFFFDPKERGAADFEERASQKLYHVVGIPTQFVIARDGKIIATIVGNGGKEDARTEGALALTGVKVDEATARQGREALAAAAAEEKVREAEAAEEEKNPKPQFREVYGKLKAGEPVPDIVVQTADGKEAKFSELTKGKTVIFSTWSAGNGPNGEWLNFQEAWAKRYADQGVVFLGLGAYGSREDFDKWRAANEGKYSFPVVWDPAGAPPRPPKPMDEMNDDEKKAFQAASREHYGKIAPLKFTGGAMAPVPNNVVIDAKGNMLGFYVGAGPGIKDSLANLLLRAGIKLAPEDMPRKVFTAADTKEAPPEARKEMLKIGAMAPDFTAQNVDGKDVKLSDFRGKVVILDFWATWCGPCMASMPHTQEVSAHYKDQGVVVLGSCTSDTRAKFESWVKTNQSKYPDIIWTHDKAERTPERVSYKLYGVSGIPTQFIIDRDGKIADIVIGYMKGEAILDGALAKAGVKVDPALVEKAKADILKRQSMSSAAPTPAPALKPAPARS